MIAFFFDSSALVKYYVSETGALSESASLKKMQTAEL